MEEWHKLRCKIIVFLEKWMIPLWVTHEALGVFAPLLLSQEVRGAVFPDGFANNHAEAIVNGAICVMIVVVIIRVLYSCFKSASLTEANNKNKSLSSELLVTRQKIDAIEKVVPVALDGILESISTELSLDNQDRISLYIVDHKGGCWHYFCCNRCAPRLDLSERSCRLRRLEGMFRKVWDESELYDDKFPPAGDSKKARQAYNQYCKKTYGITDEDVSNIRFRGRSYFGLRIDWMGEHLAFIVVASLRKSIQNKSCDDLRSILLTNCQKLGAVINSFKEYIPSPDKVEKVEGF